MRKFVFVGNKIRRPFSVVNSDRILKENRIQILGNISFRFILITYSHDRKLRDPTQDMSFLSVETRTKQGMKNLSYDVRSNFKRSLK